jgi:hypothetical protein
MIGQINRDMKFGEELYNLAKSPDINTIVEIGAWNGCGSTKCIAEGIIDSGVKKTFISLETNNDMFLLAQKNLEPYKDYVNLIRGRITELHDLTWLKGTTLNADQQVWLWEDINSYKDCPLVLDTIPEQIDLLLLDGGEFSTVPEYKVLKNRYKIIALDDIKELKTKLVHEYLLQDKNHKLVTLDNERNGYSVFKKT